MPKSRVDFPQPDSPTMARNSPGATSKLTFSTAPTMPLSSTYSTERSRISSTGSGRWGLTRPYWSSASACAIAGKPPPGASLGGLADLRRGQRAQGRVADLVEGIVDEGERGAHQGDARPRHDRPRIEPATECVVLLRPVQRGAPAHVAGVAKTDELEAGAGQDRIEGVVQEAGQQQRGHGGQDLHDDDIEGSLAPDARCQQEVSVAQGLRLGPELPGGVRPARECQHQDEDVIAGIGKISGDDDQQREQRDD